ncbi:hypothetical protein COCOBI_13-1620 [Coccomyxa sp. Obi]|nr:hypothetical protein COCOBI_13-1620 [Coccomyxa sp. Obi]
MPGRKTQRAAATLCAILLTGCVHAQYQSQARDQTTVLQHDRPGQPTIDMSHYKQVYVKCTNPTTQTSPTSPIFDTYLADLAATFTAANPLLLTGQCRRDQMNNGVAACGYTFDPTDYYRQAITNMDGRPKLTFQSCSIQLDGGNVASSNTCWTDAASTTQPSVVRSALSQTALGPITFGVTLQDNNPAVGGTRVGYITATFACKYYNPLQLLLPG